MTELKYPEAQAMYDKYRQAESDLQNNYNTISGYVNTMAGFSTSSLTSADTEGDYYDFYLNQLPKYKDEVNKNVQKWNLFLDQLKLCIKRATVKKDLWYGRIGVTK